MPYATGEGFILWGNEGWFRVDGQRTTQLFDLAKDPQETKNLAHELQYNETVDSLRRELERLRREYHDTSEQGATLWQGYSSSEA